MLWLTAVGALTPHFVVETSAIDNAKAPNIIICTRYLLITFFVMSGVTFIENIMKEMVAFFLSKGIVKGGELIIYLFIYLFFAVTYFCWSVDVFVVIVVVAVCLFVFYVFFVLCCRPVSSKHFIINFQLIWAEIIPVSCSNPNAIVAIRPAVRVTTKARIGISFRIVRNIHIKAPTKDWTIIIIAVSGLAIVAVGYVLFEVSIPVVVF